LILQALLAYLSVELVSSKSASQEEMHEMSTVSALPPRLSCSSRVSLESLQQKQAASQAQAAGWSQDRAVHLQLLGTSCTRTNQKLQQRELVVPAAGRAASQASPLHMLLLGTTCTQADKAP
jgi:3-methyladenine DNA glycosylase AlkC